MKKRKKAKEESLKHKELLKNTHRMTEFIASSKPTAITACSSESATEPELSDVLIVNQLADNPDLNIELHCSESEEVSVEQQNRSSSPSESVQNLSVLSTALDCQ